MLKRQLLIGVAASLLVASGSAAVAQEVLKLGLVLSMTGAFNTAGKAVVDGALLYLKHRRHRGGPQGPGHRQGRCVDTGRRQAAEMTAMPRLLGRRE